MVTLLIQRHQPPSSHAGCCQLGEGCTGTESSQELHLTTAEREEAEPVFCSVGCENGSSTMCDKCKKKENLQTHQLDYTDRLVHKNTHSNKEVEGAARY